MPSFRLTMAQGLVRYLMNQEIEVDGRRVPFFAGVWAIFGHGNVAGLGEALYRHRDRLPVYRAHNEQGMAHAAIAFAKTSRRQRAMACTSSIGPGATNMVTAAALAHANRLPVLLLPGDVFASRRPDPVLQQIEDFGDGTVSVNDCFRPVSRYFDRIVRPEQILNALPRAMATLTDPADCGPVVLGLCQDVQAEAFDYPEDFFAARLWRIRRPRPDESEMRELLDLIRASRKPLIIAGGGVHYSDACDVLDILVTRTGIPVAETQAGKSTLPWQHHRNIGAVGVTGTSAANAAARDADLIMAIGSRLQDFTTGSRSLFANPNHRLVQINVGAFDAHKHGATAIVGDARAVLQHLIDNLGDFKIPQDWLRKTEADKAAWIEALATVVEASGGRPSDAQVIAAVSRCVDEGTMVVCAAGGLPGELHKLWPSRCRGDYHLEYGYSCMGYEIAGGIGAKLAAPTRDVVVMVGDGSYLMMNSEIATAVMLGLKLTIVVLDNGGFGCIDRLQNATGCDSFNNLFSDSLRRKEVRVDFVTHAASLGAKAEKVSGIAELEAALSRVKSTKAVTVIVIDTDPGQATTQGGHWWDVVVAEVSESERVKRARAMYEKNLSSRQIEE